MKRLLILFIMLGTLFYTFEVAAKDSREKSERMEVVNVSDGDHLNMRDGPGASYAVKSSLPHNATGIRVLQWAEEYTGNSLWVKIAWQQRRGWVNSRFLHSYKTVLPKKKKTTTKKTKRQQIFRCSGTEPFWNIKIHKYRTKVKILDGARFTVPITFQGEVYNTLGKSTITTAKAGRRSVMIVTDEQSCNDGMSNHQFEYKATVLINGNQAYSGCCDYK
jgi:uncharacterized membrane protein